MTLALTRRGALAALASFVLPSALAVQGALAQAGVRFRHIQVDVSPLRASAGDPTANWVQRALPGALAQSMAGYMAPGDRAGPLWSRALIIFILDRIPAGLASSTPRRTRSTASSL